MNGHVIYINISDQYDIWVDNKTMTIYCVEPNAVLQLHSDMEHLENVPRLSIALAICAMYCEEGAATQPLHCHQPLVEV